MGLEAKMDMSSEDLVKSKGGNYCGFKTQKSASLCIVALFVCGAVIAASVAAIIIVPHLQSNAGKRSLLLLLSWGMDGWGVCGY